MGGAREGERALSPAGATGPLTSTPPGAGPHVEGDGQREEAGWEVAEDALEVVYVAPVTAAVGVGADEGAAVRGVQATHFSTLRKGRWGGGIRTHRPVIHWTSPT